METRPGPTQEVRMAAHLRPSKGRTKELVPDPILYPKTGRNNATPVDLQGTAPKEKRGRHPGIHGSLDEGKAEESAEWRKTSKGDDSTKNAIRMSMDESFQNEVATRSKTE